MYLGRVVGCVWSTVKNRNLEGPTHAGDSAADSGTGQHWPADHLHRLHRAGAGELIYWVRGREASYALLPQEPATDTTVVAIVDSVHLKSKAAPERPPRPRLRPRPRQGPQAEERLAHADCARVNWRIGGHLQAPSHEGLKILMVQPLNLDGTDTAVSLWWRSDAVDAGVGDKVLVVTEGFGACTSWAGFYNH